MLFDRINTLSPAGNVSKKFIFKIRTSLNKFTGVTCLTAPANVQVYPVTIILGGCTPENQVFIFPVEFKILIIPRGAPDQLFNSSSWDTKFCAEKHFGQLQALISEMLVIFFVHISCLTKPI